MVEVPVYNQSGEQVGSEQLDEAILGGQINAALLKQAVVMYHANQRQGSARTKSRGQVVGSTRKLYRQKGTGRARAGNARTPVRKGGGHTFAKRARDYGKAMPTKMRRMARNQAVLAKIQDEAVLIIDGLEVGTPKTGPFASMLKAVGADRGCVFATNGIDMNIYKSGRNIPRTEIMDVAMLNAFQVLTRRKLIFTRAAFGKFKEIVGAGSAAAG